MKKTERIKIEKLIIENFHKVSKQLGMITETIDFNSVKELLISTAKQQNLMLYKSPIGTINDFKSMVQKSNGQIPQDGVLAVDSFETLSFCYIASKTKNKGQEINMAINSSGTVRSSNNRTEDINGVEVTLLSLGANQEQQANPQQNQAQQQNTSQQSSLQTNNSNQSI